MWKKQCKSQDYDAPFSIPEICLTSRLRWQISTNLKINLWNAKLRNCDKMNASNLPQLRPRSQDTSGWEMTIIFERKKNFWHFPFLIIWVMVKFLLLPESSWRRKGRRGRGRSSITLALLLSLLSSGMRKTFRLGSITIRHHSLCSRSVSLSSWSTNSTVLHLDIYLLSWWWGSLWDCCVNIQI